MKFTTALSTAWRNRALLLAPTALALNSDEYCAILAMRDRATTLTASIEQNGELDLYVADSDGQGYCVSVAENGHVIGTHPVGG